MKLYLCNGKIPECDKRFCHINGFDCKHTSNIDFAINPKAEFPKDFDNIGDDKTPVWMQKCDKTELKILHVDLNKR